MYLTSHSGPGSETKRLETVSVITKKTFKSDEVDVETRPWEALKRSKRSYGVDGHSDLDIFSKIKTNQNNKLNSFRLQVQRHHPCIL